MGIPTLPCEHKNVRSTFHGPTEIHVSVCADCLVAIHLCSGTFPEAPPKLLVSPHGDATAYVGALEELYHAVQNWRRDPVHGMPALLDKLEAVEDAKTLMENMSLPHGPSQAPDSSKKLNFGFDLSWRVEHEDGSACRSMPLRGDMLTTHSRAEYMNKLEKGQAICAGVKHVGVLIGEKPREIPITLEQIKATRKSPFKGPSAPVPEDDTL